MPTNIHPILASDEISIPGKSLSERIELAKRENLALEVANTGNFPVELYRQCQISVVQAYARDRYQLQEAFRVQETASATRAWLNPPKLIRFTF
ncbi:MULTISPECIES: hypothetical protein [Cyanophyceae]|uniref:hypothetical protein n=1 Tax=Cyanophyceae TaxID=3028117 RepID=UPI001682FE94|nr:hypothetical protein [Trichocoleus sp. FACHB-69]MBD1931667.1 hypothetical protein [Trichocoleus sp. FACHB-69]